MIAAWITVFCVNLPLPLLYGVILTQKAGRGGMALAILTLVTLGAVGVSWSRRGGLAVVTGGWVVAASQFMPFLQIHVGMFSVSVTLGAGKEVTSVLEDETGGFLATILTGGILITVALAIGTALLMARAVFTGSRGDHHAKPVPYEMLN